MCELKPYCDKDCNECDFAKQQEAIREFNEALENIKNVVLEAFKPVADAFIELGSHIRTIMPKQWKVYNMGLWGGSYSNKKVLHLALHHPKERTRKKNINRIYKWLKKEGVSNDT